MLSKLNLHVIILRNDYGVPDLGDGHMLSKLNLQVIILKNNYGGPKLGDGHTSFPHLPLFSKLASPINRESYSI